MEMGDLPQAGTGSGFSSLRSSFDQGYFETHACDVYIRDDATSNLLGRPHPPSDDNCSHHTIACSTGHLMTTATTPRPSYIRSPGRNLPADLRTRLEDRRLDKTRWINVVGWSEALMTELARLYLGDHGCLHLVERSKRMLGGPTRAADAHEFIWLQTNIWFVGQRAPHWSSVQQTGFRMIVCLPTDDCAGTLITNFVGKIPLAREISSTCTDNVLDNHPMGQQALGCVWILAFSVLRAIAEQLDFAFQVFDPIFADRPSVPRIDDLPVILEKANNLARIDRYLSDLEEFASFFLSVRAMNLSEQSIEEDSSHAPRFRCRRISERATLESSRLQQKILHQQRLCRTYMGQYENLVQMVISFTTTQITERLDSGRTIAERFATFGLVLAGISGFISPLGLLTSFYGMNVQEFVVGANVTLFEFWQIGMPLILVAVIGLAYIALRVMTGSLLKL